MIYFLFSPNVMFQIVHFFMSGTVSVRGLTYEIFKTEERKQTRM